MHPLARPQSKVATTVILAQPALQLAAKEADNYWRFVNDRQHHHANSTTIDVQSVHTMLSSTCSAQITRATARILRYATGILHDACYC